MAAIWQQCLYTVKWCLMQKYAGTLLLFSAAISEVETFVTYLIWNTPKCFFFLRDNYIYCVLFSPAFNRRRRKPPWRFTTTSTRFFCTGVVSGTIQVRCSISWMYVCTQCWWTASSQKYEEPFKKWKNVFFLSLQEQHILALLSDKGFFIVKKNFLECHHTTLNIAQSQPDV